MALPGLGSQKKARGQGWALPALNNTWVPTPVAGEHTSPTSQVKAEWIEGFLLPSLRPFPLEWRAWLSLKMRKGEQRWKKMPVQGRRQHVTQLFCQKVVQSWKEPNPVLFILQLKRAAKIGWLSNSWNSSFVVSPCVLSSVPQNVTLGISVCETKWHSPSRRDRNAWCWAFLVVQW